MTVDNATQLSIAWSGIRLSQGLDKSGQNTGLWTASVPCRSARLPGSCSTHTGKTTRAALSFDSMRSGSRVTSPIQATTYCPQGCRNIRCGTSPRTMPAQWSYTALPGTFRDEVRHLPQPAQPRARPRPLPGTFRDKAVHPDRLRLQGFRPIPSQVRRRSSAIRPFLDGSGTQPRSLNESP